MNPDPFDLGNPWATEENTPVEPSKPPPPPWKYGYCRNCRRELVPDLDPHVGICSPCHRGSR